MKLRSFCISQNVRYFEKFENDPMYHKFYELENPEHETIVAVPDGCIDIQFFWKKKECLVVVCGSYLQGDISLTSEYDRCFGVKFNLGVVPKIFSSRIPDLANHRMELTDFPFTEDFYSCLDSRDSFEMKITKFKNCFQRFEQQETDNLTSYILRSLKAQTGVCYITGLVNETGYGHRHTNIVFKKNLGLTIKKCASILRVQEALECIAGESRSCLYEQTAPSGLQCDYDRKNYHELGYYDQSHYIHEFKKFTLHTPNDCVKQADRIRFV